MNKRSQIAAIVSLAMMLGMLPIYSQSKLTYQGSYHPKNIVCDDRAKNSTAVSYLIKNSRDSIRKYPYRFKSTGNPVIRHMRTADPSAHVWKDGQLWLYASHDMDDATDYYSMDGYHVFSTKDMVNWTDWGEVLHSRDVKWGLPGTMWAPDCAYKNGRYYFYFPHKDKEGKWRTGVAISNKPQGPFKPIDNYIEGTSGIDPCCFIDKDGQAYLYFNQNLMAKLKDNMTELAEPARKISYDGQEAPGIEGTYMHERNGIYYYSWSNPRTRPDQGFYATGISPYGPFINTKAINEKPPGAQDHHSIIEFKGKNYYFYHIGNYNGGNSFRRNINVDYLNYNEDGTIQKIIQTKNGVSKAK